LIEIYKRSRNIKFIDLLRKIIYNGEHTIFYYMDIFYYHSNVNEKYISDNFIKDDLEQLESGDKVFKYPRSVFYLMTYYFLLKLFVYLHYYSNKEDLDELSNYLFNDIKSLDTHKANNINKMEYKGISY
jgi:hypothetical protein